MVVIYRSGIINKVVVIYRSDVVNMVVYPLQVGGLEAGETYVFRVRSVNADGVGKASQVSEPILAKALPGNPRFLPSSLPAFLPFPTTLFISLFVSFHCIKSYPLFLHPSFLPPILPSFLLSLNHSLLFFLVKHKV